MIKIGAVVAEFNFDITIKVPTNFAYKAGITRRRSYAFFN